MMRFLTTLLLPIWLTAGCLGCIQPIKAATKVNAEASSETKISKVEAAPVVILQVQAPQADWCLPEPIGVEIHLQPENQVVQPLRANGRAASPSFGHRFYKIAIALRAP
jgi:hypothetical protein